MIRYTKTTIIATNLDGRPLRNTSERTVRIRIQTRGKGRYLSTGIPLTKQQYEASFGKNARKPRDGEKENLILAEFEHIYNIIRKLEDGSDKPPSYESIKTAAGIKQKENNCISLKELFDDYMETLEKKNNFQRVNQTRSIVKSFATQKLLHKNADAITTNDIEKWIERLQKEGKKTNTINIYTRVLSTIYNNAIREKMLTYNPVAETRILPRHHTTKKIKEDTLRFILTATKEATSLKSSDYEAMQYFKVCFWAGGANIGDILGWTYDNIIENEIVFSRRKTKDKSESVIHIPLSEPLLETMEFLPKGKKHLFPVLDGVKPNSKEENTRIIKTRRQINDALNKLCNEKGFDKITFSYARHMYPTIMARTGANLKMISSGMGHTTSRTTEVFYMEDFTKEQRKNEADKMQKYILGE